MRVLIADDDRDLVEAIAEYVRECGHEVCATVTGGGLAVIQQFARHLPDVVILDLGLPDVDGLDVCRTLRRSSRVPIVMLTRRSTEADRAAGLDAGADAYLVKPFDAEELLAVVRGLLPAS